MLATFRPSRSYDETASVQLSLTEAHANQLLRPHYCSEGINLVSGSVFV